MHLKRGNINTWLQKIDEFDLDVQIFEIMKTYKDQDLQLSLLIAKFNQDFKFIYKTKLIDLENLVIYYNKFINLKSDFQESELCNAFLKGTLNKWYTIICEMRGRNENIFLEKGLSLPGKIINANISLNQAGNVITLYLASLLDASSSNSDDFDLDFYLIRRLSLFIEGKKYQECFVLIEMFEQIFGDSQAFGVVKSKIRSEFAKRIRQEQQDAVLEEAYIELKNKKIDEAIRIIDTAISIEQEYAKAWYCKGLALADLSLYDEALIAFSRAIQLDPKKGKTWYNIGHMLFNLGRYQEALEAYYEAIDINPDYSDVLYNISETLCNLGMYQQALTTLENRLIHVPEDLNAWSIKGDILFQIGEFDKCIETYLHITSVNHEYRISWRNLADALYNLNRYDEALLSYNKSIEIDPLDAGV